MSFFEWKDEYSVKIAPIDRQHRKIIELMDELFESIRDGRGDLVIGEILGDLERYTDYHFGLEAGLFTKYGYSKSKEHLAEHSFFVEKIQTLKSELSSDAEGASIETLDFLKGWFRNHMLKIDSDYSSFFDSRKLIEEIETAFKEG